MNKNSSRSTKQTSSSAPYPNPIQGTGDAGTYQSNPNFFFKKHHNVFGFIYEALPNYLANSKNAQGRSERFRSKPQMGSIPSELETLLAICCVESQFLPHHLAISISPQKKHAVISLTEAEERTQVALRPHPSM